MTKWFTKAAIAGVFAVSVTAPMAMAPMAMAADVDLQTKVALQSTLDTYIEKSSVDGQLTLIDVNARSMTSVFMSNAHPMIVPIKGGKYFLCADGYDADGNEVKLDFLVVAENNEYQIVDTILNGREEIKTIMKAQ